MLAKRKFIGFETVHVFIYYFFVVGNKRKWSFGTFCLEMYSFCLLKTGFFKGKL